MAKARAIIADDEEQLRKYLRARLSEVWPELIICAEAKNGQEALTSISEYHPDIAFLDIRMSGLSGMEVAREVAGSCRVVFITAYDQYALEAFENEAVDYLLKPISGERLAKTVERLKERLGAAAKPPAETPAVVDRLTALLEQREVPGYLNWIKVQRGNNMRIIPADAVCYFKAGDKYTAVIAEEGESLIRKPIKELAAELDPVKFWQVHRGTIVNAAYIANVARTLTGRGILSLRDRPETLTVSQRYMHLFKQM